MLKLKSSIAILVLGLSFVLFCVTSAQAQGWVDQFGSYCPPGASGCDDVAKGIASDSTGIYVVGTYVSTFPAGTGFLRKYNYSGGLLFELGNFSGANKVAVNLSSVPGPRSPYIYVAGDGFIRMYDNTGVVLKHKWLADFNIKDIAVNSSGVYVIAEPSEFSSLGSGKVYVKKFDALLTYELWSKMLTVNPGQVHAGGIAADLSSVYVVGNTSGSLRGQPISGSSSAFIAKYNNSNGDFAGSFGSNGIVQYEFYPAYNYSYARDVALDQNGNLYIAGDAMSPTDVIGIVRGMAFVERRNSANGSLNWNTQFGSDSGVAIYAYGVCADLSGVGVTGYLKGNLPGKTLKGGYDGYLRRYKADGSGLLMSEQFGTSLDDKVFDITEGGSSYFLAGGTVGALTGSNLGGEDAFVARFYLPFSFGQISYALHVISNSIETMGLSAGTSNSLLAKIDAAQKSLPAPVSGVAASSLGSAQINGEIRQNIANQLQAFINQCEALRGKKIPESQADSLIQMANEIINLIKNLPQ